MDAVTPRYRCIECGREIEGEVRWVPVNSRMNATAHPECAK